MRGFRYDVVTTGLPVRGRPIRLKGAEAEFVRQELEETVHLLVELLNLLLLLSDLLVLVAVFIVGRALVVPTFLPSHLRARAAVLVGVDEDRVLVVGDGVLAFAYEL